MRPSQDAPRLSVLTLCYEFPPLGGGGGRVARGLAMALADQRHEVDLVTTQWGGLPAFEDIEGISVWRVRGLRSRIDRSNVLELASYLPFCLYRAWQLASRKSYDVVHAHFIFPDGIVAWALRLLTGHSYLITAHGSDVPGYNPDRFALTHKLLRPLWHSVVRRAEAVICPSASLRDVLHSHSPEAPVVVLPNGFDPDRFQTGSLRHKTNEILCVLRIVERKGLQHLLNAVARLSAPVRIRIVGDGLYGPEVRRQAERLGIDAVFEGWLDNDSPELAALFRSCGIFVLPSSSENFPVSLLEAMSAGMAIVTTRGTGCEDVVGDCALLTDYGCIEGLTSALESLARDKKLRRVYGDKARRRLLERYSWDNVSRQYMAVYRRYRCSPPMSRARG